MSRLLSKYRDTLYSMTRSLSHHIIPAAIFLSLTFTLCRNFFRPSTLPVGTDIIAIIRSIGFFSEGHRYYYLWKPIDIGTVSPVTPGWVLLNIFIHDPVLVSEILIFTCTLLAQSSMYALVHMYCGDRKAACISAILYVLNPFYICLLYTSPSPRDRG